MFVCVFFGIFFVQGAGISSEIATLQRVTLQLPDNHRFRFAGFYAALHQHYYERENLAVSIRNGGGKKIPIEEVVSQRATFGVADERLLHHKLMGRPIVMLSPIMQHSTWGFISRPDSAIFSPHDMIHRSLLLPEDSTDIATHTFTLANEHIPLNTLTVVAGSFHDFLQGTGDILYADALDALFHLQSGGKHHTFIPPRAYGVDFYGDTLFTSYAFYHNNPQISAAFTRASLKGWEYALNHPYEIIEYMLATFPSSFSKEYLVYEVENIRNYIGTEGLPLGSTNRGRWTANALLYNQAEKINSGDILAGFFVTDDKATFELSFLPVLLVLFFLLVIPCAILLLHYKHQVKKHATVSHDPPDPRQLEKECDSWPEMAVIGLDRKGEIVVWNMAAEKLTGKHKNEVLGRKIADLQLFSRPTLDCFSEVYTSSSESPGCHFSYTLNHTFNTEDTGYCYAFSWTAGFYLFLCTHSTEDEHLPHNTITSDHRYQFLLQQMTEGFVLFEMEYTAEAIPIDCTFLAINPAFEKMTGLDGKKVIGQKMSKIFPHFDRKWLPLYNRVATTGMHSQFIDSTLDKNKYYHIAACSPQNGQLACFFIDITEKKVAEDKVEYQASLLDTIDEGIVVTTGDGHIRYWNSGAIAIFNHTVQEAIGNSFAKFTGIIFSELQEKEKRKALPKMGWWKGEVICTKKNGERLPVRLTQRAISNTVDRTTGDLYIIEDLSEKKALTRMLQNYQKTDMVQTLAKNLTHSLNNLLVTILGYCEIAVEDIPVTEPTRHNLEKILQASHQARKLINQFTLCGHDYLQAPVELELMGIVDEVLQLLKSSIPSTVEIIRDVDKSTGPIRGDYNQIYQILLHIVTTTISVATTDGGTLRLKIVPGQSPPAQQMDETTYVALVLECDSTPATIVALAEVFSHENTLLLKTITEEHGGLYTYSYGKNPAKITLYFPELTKKIFPESSEQLHFSQGQETILIVDDEENIVEITGKALKKLGYKAVTATDSTEALELYSQSPYDFDLLITDQTMPKISGTELIRLFHSQRPELPVILLTGYANLLDSNHAKELGITKILSKPLTKIELANVVREVLDTAGGRTADLRE